VPVSGVIKGSPTMRSVLLLPLVALLATSPAVAQNRGADDAEIARMADRLNSPVAQAGMADMMTALSGMLMSMRVDGLGDAVRRVDPRARTDPFGGARTVGEMMSRDDPDFQRNIGERSRQGAAMMGSMASMMARMLPQFRAMAEQMGRDVERTARDAAPVRR
jgi:hypothetical protein